MKTFNRVVSGALIICLLGVGAPVPAAAEIVATEQLAVSGERDQVRSFLDRADVREQLHALGIDAQAAAERVGALSDEEIASLAGRLDELPAGGTDVLGVLLVVFIVLLITDILGYTKVFPFTRPVK